MFLAPRSLMSECGFARSRRAGHDDQLPGRDIKIYVEQDLRAGVVVTEVMRDLAGTD
jgi:hypothetical protein